MNEQNSRHSNRQAPRGDQTGENREIAEAMARFEKAVQDLVSTTAGHLGDRATSLIDETSKRLEAELRLKRASSDPGSERRQARRRRRHRHRHRLSHRAERRRSRSSRLVMDRHNKKIAGVCGGIARYFGFESWAVRMGALTGLIFLPQIVFPAYWIIYFIMDKTPHPEDEYDYPDAEDQPRGRRRSRTPERDPGRQPRGQREEQFIPRRTLRNTTADMTQAELRLRRLESFVTSDQYELQKQLTIIEKDGDPQGAR